MKQWDIFYWNKHEYCWKWLGIAEGETAHEAIRWAKKCFPDVVGRRDVMKVSECTQTGQAAVLKTR